MTSPVSSIYRYLTNVSSLPSESYFKLSKDYIGIALVLGITLVIVIPELFEMEN